MAMNEGVRYIRVDDDNYEDLEFLRQLGRFKGLNSCIGYLLTCYGVYCNMLGLKNYELMREHRRKRIVEEQKRKMEVIQNGN